MTTGRVYLDWNASAPLRSEARAAMLSAIDAVGNPSSVHAEGRAARAIVERARTQLAEAFGAQSSDVVFTSGATEAAALALAGRELSAAPIEHDAVRAWVREDLTCSTTGVVTLRDPTCSCLQAANSETGIVQDVPEGLAVSDFTQAFGKLPVGFDWSGVAMGFLSAHKIGGPRGVGALVLRRGLDVPAQIRGGGQELGRRSGTENVSGIAGFGAAAAAAVRDLEAGVWAKVAKLRNILEKGLADADPSTIFVGKASKRLPNTSCVILPGWKGETQVMQMDLAGFAVSAGSACSSGKVRGSPVLKAMGYDDLSASSALRVSLGPQTSESDVARFVEAWAKHVSRFRARAA